jgi:hypothetical protein
VAEKIMALGDQTATNMMVKMWTGYWEARGHKKPGMFAVAQSLANRAAQGYRGSHDVWAQAFDTDQYSANFTPQAGYTVESMFDLYDDIPSRRAALEMAAISEIGPDMAVESGLMSRAQAEKDAALRRDVEAAIGDSTDYFAVSMLDKGAPPYWASEKLEKGMGFKEYGGQVFVVEPGLADPTLTARIQAMLPTRDAREF